MVPAKGSTFQYSGLASTTSMWFSKMSGRALPSPARRAYRFALPGLGSKSCAVMPSRASTALSHSAVLSSLPGGLVVLIATYCDKSAAASRPTARQSASLRGRPGSPNRGGRSTGWLDGPNRPGGGGRDDQGEQRGAAHESSRQGNGGTRKLRAGEARGEPPPQCTVIVAWPVLPS